MYSFEVCSDIRYTYEFVKNEALASITGNDNFKVRILKDQSIERTIDIDTERDRIVVPHGDELQKMYH